MSASPDGPEAASVRAVVNGMVTFSVTASALAVTLVLMLPPSVAVLCPESLVFPSTFEVRDSGGVPCRCDSH